MADTYHPRLTDDFELKPTEEQPGVANQDETPAAETEATANAAETVEQPNDDQPAQSEEAPQAIEQPTEEKPPQEPTPATDDEFYIKLDKRNAYAELAKLDQDPAWREHLRTFGGRKVKRELEGKVQLLQKQLAAEQGEKEHLKFQAELAKTLAEQGEDAVQEKLRTDPEFARRYHQSPETVDMSQVQESMQLANHIENLFEWGMEQGVPQHRIEQYRQALRSQYFDYRQVNGQPDRNQPLSPYESVSMLQAMLTGEAQQMAAQRTQAQQTQRQPQPPPPPVAEAPVEPAPKANPALAAGGPDLSSSGPSKSSDGKITMEEYRALTPPEKMSRWPTKGLEELMKEGVVIAAS